MKPSDRNAIQSLEFLADLDDEFTRFGVFLTNQLGGIPTRTSVRCLKISSGLLVEAAAWVDLAEKKVLDWNVNVTELPDGWRIERDANLEVDDWHEALPNVEFATFEEVRTNLPALTADLLERAPEILVRLNLRTGI